MYKVITVFLLGMLIAVSSSGPAAENRGELDRILAKMNEFGRGFRSLSANITQQRYIAVLKESQPEEKGTFQYKRAKDGSARLRKEIVQPAPNIAVVDGNYITTYEPRVKQARRIGMGKYKDKTEFLAIGIGQSPAKLEENFDLKAAGSEVIDGRKTYILELTPKSTKTSAFFTKIILWIDAERGNPVQQKFIEPNSDFTLVKFSNIKVNANIPDSVFKIKLPKDVEVIAQ
jgi:outer membrane lipoprotein-sorting protein